VRFVVGGFSIFFTALLFAATVPAGSAISNLASWAQLLNLPIAHTLSKTYDWTSQWISYAALAVAVSYYSLQIYENHKQIKTWLLSWWQK